MRPRTMLKFRSIHHVIVLILVAWAIVFAYHERYSPYKAAARCQWPQINVESSAEQQQPVVIDDQNPDSVASNDVINIMLVADPQLIDSHTYPGRNKLLLKLSQHTVDVYLKKNYKAMLRALNPSYVFFLGDYLDNGRLSTDKYFRGQLERFNSIFKRKKYKKGKKWMINLPGNHDIGWADGVKIPSRKRFKKYFGNPNSVKVINNVEFISLDTISLSAMEESIYGPAREFFDTNFGTSIVKTKPRVLFTHVPLYRDPNELTCGPLRESSVFHTSKGYQYQLVLSPELSSDILNRIKPDLIFSGDDHDYCDVNHPSPSGENETFREITVKSISMAMGIKYPAIQILSFANSGNDNDYNIQNQFKYETNLCYLPTPYINIACYVVTAVVSGLVLLWYDLSRKHPRHGYATLPLAGQPSTVSTTRRISDFLKEQDEAKEVVMSSIPNYTNTKVPQKSMAEKMKELGAMLKRTGLVQFLKHAAITGMLVILLYTWFIVTA